MNMEMAVFKLDKEGHDQFYQIPKYLGIWVKSHLPIRIVFTVLRFGQSSQII